jgi:N-acetylglutamate synthase-like GNAT family acetyltransferase
LYSHNWRAAGISNVELVERLVSLARERQTEQEAVVTTFSTNYLKQF